MKENIKLILKGFVIGIGKIIPGVSGAMLAISLGIYEQGLHAISHVFKEFKQHFKFLLFLGIGISLAIVLGSKIVVFSLNNYYLPTMLLFIGMISGGIKPLIKEVKSEKVKVSNIFCSLFVIFALVGLSFLNLGADKSNFTKSFSSLFMFFLGGIFDASATVIPGISGTALLMILGYYNIIMTSFGSIFEISKLSTNMFILIPFGIGFVFGVFVLAKVMDYLFSRHRTMTYYGIIGFAISSIFLLIGQTLGKVYSVGEILISLVLFIIGYIIAQKLDK